MLRWTLGCTCLFQIWFLWCVCPEVGLLGHMAVLFPVFSEISTLFSIVAVLVCIPMSLLFNILSRLVIIFLPRSKHLLISWLQSPSAVILEPTKMYHSAVLVIMLYITSLVLTLHWKFVLFYDLPPIPFLPILHSWQLHIYFLWVWFFPRLWLHVRSYSVCVSLTYFAEYNPFSVHPCCHKW